MRLPPSKVTSNFTSSAMVRPSDVPIAYRPLSTDTTVVTRAPPSEGILTGGSDRSPLSATNSSAPAAPTA